MISHEFEKELLDLLDKHYPEMGFKKNLWRKLSIELEVDNLPVVTGEFYLPFGKETNKITNWKERVEDDSAYY